MGDNVLVPLHFIRSRNSLSAERSRPRTALASILINLPFFAGFQNVAFDRDPKAYAGPVFFRSQDLLRSYLKPDPVGQLPKSHSHYQDFLDLRGDGRVVLYKR